MANLRETCHCVRIQDLPEEILERIMSYLSPYNDCKNASLVSRKWRRLMQGVVKQRRQTFHLAARTGSLKWSHKEQDGNSIHARCMHSSCCVDDIMYCFGGTIPSSPMTTGSGTCYCDLQKLDLGKRMWTRLMPTGEYPPPKAAASMVHHNGSLILFGGWAPPVPVPAHQPPHFFNDLHIYDIADNRWRSVVSSTSPPTLASHRASMVDDLMIIFGGGSGSRKKENDVWVLSLHSMMWSCMEIQGKKPAARDKHVQVVLDDGHILVIGGLGNFDKELNDVWMLDISEVPWYWQEINIVQQQHAAPRIFSHAACKIGESVVFFSSLRTNPKAARISPWQVLHDVRHLQQLARPPQPRHSRQLHHSAHSSREGVERGSLKDLHREAKRPYSKVSEKTINDSASCQSWASDTNGETSHNSDRTGCPCSPDCQCKTPVTCTITPANCRISPAKLGLDPPLYSKIPHGEQQYVLDVSKAVSDLQVEWLEIPDQNAGRALINPSHPAREIKYGFAPEAMFSTVCVGRAEIVRFGGMLMENNCARALNGQYYAY